MQKFIKLNSGTSGVEEQSTLHPSQVKLVGYLKKKRTKVGGWRKMWFVLQNQLLLSYPSKEDYDKKLVSFKDALNLVPGTIVRPLGGYRFAIQTTSESVYIFRCDDNKTYMEWITALVDSLSIGKSSAKKKNPFDGGALLKKPLHASHSCSSLVRSKKNKAVHIPIAHGTARILNRTGLSESDLRAFSSTGCSFHDINARTHYSSLHEHQLLLQNQSNAVSRINRMFCGSASDVDLSSVKHAGTSDTGLAQQATTSTTGFKGLQCESDGEISQRSVINRKMHDLLNFIKTENLNTVGDKVKECEISRDINANGSLGFEKFLDSGSEAFSRNQNEDGERNATIEDQIQRLSLRGSSGFVVNDSRNISTDQEENCLRLSTTIRREVSSPFLRHRRKPEQGCSSSSSAGSSASSERRNESSYNGDDSEISEDVKKNTPDEPIYAVVDLKNKYEHRARIRHELEERRKSRTSYLKSLDEVTTDYEEVLNFPNDHFNDNKDTASHGYDDENIYEPINIPEPSYSNHKHRNVLWKYISRINIDALIELARNRKKSPKPSEHTSPFANIKQKFGHHRKSIRIRMIKLYTRDQHPEEEVEDTDDSKTDQV